MVSDDFFDAFLTAGFLPGLAAVTLTSPDGVTTTAVLDARREPITEDLMAMAGIGAGTSSAVFFFPVDQPGWVRPRLRWTITELDGTVWVVDKDDLTIQARGVPVVCSLSQGTT